MKISVFRPQLLLLLCAYIVSGCAHKSNRISSIDDLKEKRIGVLQGSVHDIYATKTFPKATILQYKGPSDMILAVKSGKIDAGIYTSDELVELMRRQPEIGIFGSPLFSSDLGLGFHKDNPELRSAFNRFLKQIRSNGVYDDMVTRWMKNGDTRMPCVPKTEPGAPLVVGLVSDNGLPFTAVKDNRLVGFNIELLERFAAFSGREDHLSRHAIRKPYPGACEQEDRYDRGCDVDNRRAQDTDRFFRSLLRSGSQFLCSQKEYRFPRRAV